MNESQYISYFENLSIQSKYLNHLLDKKESFFFVENGYDLDEFDEALKNAVQSPVMLLVADDGEFIDSNSENHNHILEGQFFILFRKSDENSIREIRAKCLPIVTAFLARMKHDSRTGKIIPDKIVQFRIEKNTYNKVGPINLEWYGYAVNFEFTCPFGFKVDSGTWHDR